MSGIQQGLVASLGGKLIELADVFNATVYTGNGASRTITTNIDTLNEGGLVWIKNLDRGTSGHGLFSTAYGTGGNEFLTPAGHDGTRIISTEGVSQAAVSSNVGFTSAGFTLGTDTAQAINNFYVQDYLALTFRKAPKFFDVVTYTGTGSARTVAHNLGSTPGMVIVKCTSHDTGNWRVYHRSLTSAAYTISLNTTAAESSQPSVWNSTAPTSSEFTVGTDITVNESGKTYVAFVFAHQAGGFGASRALNAVSCGSYTGTGSVLQVDCGFASSARFVLIKPTDSSLGWWFFDSTRGIVAGGDSRLLVESQTPQEVGFDEIDTFATGFELTNTGSGNINSTGKNYIYLAIA